MIPTLAGLVLLALTAHGALRAQSRRGDKTAIAGVTVIPCAACTSAGATSRTEMSGD